MGSLLKEYLSSPQKEFEIPNSSAMNSEEVKVTEEKVISVENADTKDSSVIELKNSEGTSECVRNGDQESHAQQSCTPERGTNMQYKNVVAIVDPPRVGLHPTVRTLS